MRIATRGAMFGSALVLVGAPTAEAKSPPPGKYECTIGVDHTLFGDILIKGGNRYRFSRFGGIGSFDGKNKPSAFPGGVPTTYGIRFTHGGLNHFKGRWYKTTDGGFEIALENPRDGYESIYCDKPPR
jgi:hypothetical protein